MLLEGKVALITGGVSGIGRAVALRFAAEGAAGVAVNYSVSEAEAAETAEALGERGLPVRADVSDSAAVREMIDRVVDRFGRLDILVNNAATTRFSSFDEVDDELWTRVLGVNLNGPFFCIKAALPHLRAAGKGAVVNVSSVGGIAPVGSSAAYSVSKAGLNHLTRVAAKALGPTIRVNGVAPGLVFTRWNAGRPAAGQDAQVQEAPLKMGGQPEDIADAVLFFASDQSRFITGQTLIIDGGRYMQ
ncbi:MAG: SDR family NAD(P)-dependent oxidoreductase [Dehalococcoidia bacterium]